MPIIKVYGLPRIGDLFYMEDLVKQFVLQVESIPELGLKREDVTAFFPQSIRDSSLDKKIIIVEVTGLFQKPQRTIDVRQRLAKVLGEVTTNLFPEYLVECFVYSFHPDQGFWSSNDKTVVHEPLPPPPEIKKERRKRCRYTDEPITEKDWEIIMSTPMTKAQKRFLNLLMSTNNTEHPMVNKEEKRNYIESSVRENLNTRFIQNNFPYRLRAKPIPGERMPPWYDQILKIYKIEETGNYH